MILIDFGKTEPRSINNTPYDSLMQERFMEWVPIPLRIRLDEINKYETYRKNYINHISGPKILEVFHIRNRTLSELVNFMVSQSQFVTGGRNPRPIKPMVGNWVTSESKSLLKDQEDTDAKENIHKFLEFLQPYYYDIELEELLKVEPNLKNEKDTELEELLKTHPNLEYEPKENMVISNSKTKNKHLTQFLIQGR